MLTSFEPVYRNGCQLWTYVLVAVMANRHGSDNPDKIPVGNPGYGIRAALGYTAMFTELAANILDVHLPRRCSFR